MSWVSILGGRSPCKPSICRSCNVKAIPWKQKRERSEITCLFFFSYFFLFILDLFLPLSTPRTFVAWPEHGEVTQSAPYAHSHKEAAFSHLFALLQTPKSDRITLIILLGSHFNPNPSFFAPGSARSLGTVTLDDQKASFCHKFRFRRVKLKTNKIKLKIPFQISTARKKRTETISYFAKNTCKYLDLQSVWP